MKIKKVGLSLTLAFVFLFINFSVIQASENKTIEVPDGVTVTSLSLDETPEGIIPLYFNTLEEAEMYIANMQKTIEIEKENYEKLRAQVDTQQLKENIVMKTDMVPFSTNYLVEVDKWSTLPTTVTLWARYGTSGPNKTGTVTYVSPYTLYTGFPLFSSWDESVCSYYLESNQKDAYIFASGTANLYFVIEDVGNIARFPVHLGRTCYLAR